MIPPRVAVLVVSYNTRDDLLACLGSLEGVGVPLEILVVDNASTDGSAEAVRKRFPGVRLIENPANLGFSAANNLALRQSKAPFVLLLNPDARVGAGSVETLLARLEEREDVGIVGPRTRGEDGKIQLSFGPDLTLSSEWRQRGLVRGLRRGDPGVLAAVETLCSSESEPDWVSASCLLARRRCLEGIGGFDEGFFLYEEDVDLCVRARAAGFRVLFTPAAEVVHSLGRSMAASAALSRLEYHKSHLRYYRKHRGLFQQLLLRSYLAALGVPGALVRGDSSLLRLGLFGHA